jgi:hypothetical protein
MPGNMNGNGRVKIAIGTWVGLWTIAGTVIGSLFLIAMGTKADVAALSARVDAQAETSKEVSRVTTGSIGVIREDIRVIRQDLKEIERRK